MVILKKIRSGIKKVVENIKAKKPLIDLTKKLPAKPLLDLTKRLPTKPLIDLTKKLSAGPTPTRMFSQYKWKAGDPTIKGFQEMTGTPIETIAKNMGMNVEEAQKFINAPQTETIAGIIPPTTTLIGAAGTAGAAGATGTAGTSEAGSPLKSIITALAVGGVLYYIMKK